MMVEKSTLDIQAYDHPTLIKVYESLSNKFLFSENFYYTENLNIQIQPQELKKAIWLCSILASSNDENHKIRAQRFATLLFLTSEIENLDLFRTCYIIFSRLGNLTATLLFRNRFNSKSTTGEAFYDYDGVLSMELILERISKTILTSNKPILTTSFQKGLWNSLNSPNNLAISAPTSSGKSYIIKQYLIEKYKYENQFRAIYLVPSRALINQVSEEFRIELFNSEAHVKTAFIHNHDLENNEEEKVEIELENKELYILTPERCIKLLQFDQDNKIEIDFIFVDEIQGVEDEQGRGSVLENVLQDLSIQFPNSKLITAGPNISNPHLTFEEIFRKNAVSVSTEVSPVIQIKKIVRADDSGNFEVEVRDSLIKPILFKINSETNAQYIFKNWRNGRVLEHIINIIAPKSYNIIYCNRGDYAEKWAIEYQESKTFNSSCKRIQELIEFLKEEINDKYYLIDCLKKGIAFHHGKLPDIIRKEVEELFQKRKISNLFCTSTLIEGVNLPAKNLFLLTPRKNLEELTDFEFGNLIGRAGRLNESLFGTIYFIEKPDYDGKSAKDYYDGEYQKEIKTFSSRSLPFYNFDYLDIELNDIIIFNENGKQDLREIVKQKQLTVLIRNKFIKSEEDVLEYLLRKGVKNDVALAALEKLQDLLSDLIIPKKIILENQSIDPIHQNRLYERIKNEKIENWVITPNSILEKRRNKEFVADLNNEERPFFWQLLNIIKKLDEIFNISQEAFQKYQVSVNPTKMAIHASTWLQGKSYKELINDDIRYYSEDPRVPAKDKVDPNDKKAVNRLIGDIIKFNSSITTYLLVKYFNLLVNVLEIILTENQKDEFKMTMALPTALELGTRDRNVRVLISNGITRSVAIKVTKIYKKKTTDKYRKENTVLDWLKKQNEIKELKPIYNRYLSRLKLFKSSK